MSTSPTPGGPRRRGAVGAAIAGLVVGAIAAGGAYAYANGVGAKTDTPAASSADRLAVADAVAALDRPQVDPSLGALPTATAPTAKARTHVVRRARVVLVTQRVHVATAKRGSTAEDGLAAGAGQPAGGTKHESDDGAQGDDAGKGTGDDNGETEIEDQQRAGGQGSTHHAGDGGGDQQGGNRHGGDHQGGGDGGNGGGGQGGDD